MLGFFAGKGRLLKRKLEKILYQATINHGAQFNRKKEHKCRGRPGLDVLIGIRVNGRCQMRRCRGGVGCSFWIALINLEGGWIVCGSPWPRPFKAFPPSLL